MTTLAAGTSWNDFSGASSLKEIPYLESHTFLAGFQPNVNRKCLPKLLCLTVVTLQEKWRKLENGTEEWTLRVRRYVLRWALTHVQLTMCLHEANHP